MAATGTAAPDRLARRLGTGDAVVLGLGAMIGAGVFAAYGPAARAAGAGLLVSLALAAIVAFANATSSAQLAAIYPESGGTYVYGRERLGPAWGFLAGWGFVTGKTASCSALALTFGAYAAPSLARPLALAAVVALVAVNYLGVTKTAALTRVIVACVLAVLAFVVAAALIAGAPSSERLAPLAPHGLYGLLQAAGILFFAFAGYARIATLGEEVRDPATTIPRAIPAALAITLIVYAAVAVSALLAVGPGALASSAAPLRTVVEAGTWHSLAPLVRAGAAIATLGVLLSLLAGVSRTAFAMAANRELPRRLAAVHPRHGVPHVAELAIGAIVLAVTAFADVRGAIGFSSFAVLSYYAIANASALTLTGPERRRQKPLAWVGLAGCVVLAGTLPWESVLAAAVVLALGSVLGTLAGRRRSESLQEPS